MSTIFLDECGYTGEDLLNRDQPIFTLASLNLPESECQELKKLFFGKVQSVELKYSSLSRRPKQQQMILRFLNELSQNPGLVKFSHAHKQYVLVTKMVEMLVEPAYYEVDLDLYDKGGNIALANLLFHTLPVFGGKDLFDKLLANFQLMMRLRTKEAYQSFFELLTSESYSEDLCELLNFFRMSHIHFGRELLNTKDNLEIAVSCTLALMFSWRQDIEDDIILVHDRSSAMAKQKQIWDTVVDPNVEPVEVGYDRRKVSFPIRVIETCSEDSKCWSGLQLVDILAGAFTDCIKWLLEGKDESNHFGRDLIEIISNSFISYSIWPEMKFTPQVLDTVEGNAISPHDHFVELLMKRLP